MWNTVIPNDDRPSTWIPEPSIGDNEEVAYGLMEVVVNSANKVEILIRGGGHIIDWGDGNVEEYAGNVLASHFYNFEDVDDTYTQDNGVRQVYYKITPKPGAHITEAHFAGIFGTGGFYNCIELLLNLRYAIKVGVNNYKDYNTHIALVRCKIGRINQPNLSWMFQENSSPSTIRNFYMSIIIFIIIYPNLNCISKI
jgi:hypothetical protein